MSRGKHLIESALGGKEDGHDAFEGQHSAHLALPSSKSYIGALFEI